MPYMPETLEQRAATAVIETGRTLIAQKHIRINSTYGKQLSTDLQYQFDVDYIVRGEAYARGYLPLPE